MCFIITGCSSKKLCALQGIHYLAFQAFLSVIESPFISSPMPSGGQFGLFVRNCIYILEYYNFLDVNILYGYPVLFKEQLYLCTYILMRIFSFFLSFQIPPGFAQKKMYIYLLKTFLHFLHKKSSWIFIPNLVLELCQNPWLRFQIDLVPKKVRKEEIWTVLISKNKNKKKFTFQKNRRKIVNFIRNFEVNYYFFFFYFQCRICLEVK